MHPIEEILNKLNEPEIVQLYLIDRLQATSFITVPYPDNKEEATEYIELLNKTQLCPIKQIGRYSITQLNYYIKTKIINNGL